MKVTARLARIVGRGVPQVQGRGGGGGVSVP